MFWELEMQEGKLSAELIGAKLSTTISSEKRA